MEELVEASKAFYQKWVQQSSMEQIIANRAISLAEKTVEMPVTRTKEKTQHVVNTHVQHAVNTVEAEKPIINETIKKVTKHVEIPQLQIVDVPGFSNSGRNCRGDPTYSTRPNVQSRRSKNRQGAQVQV